MTQAADIDPRFAFEAREWPNGHYVHTLGSFINSQLLFNIFKITENVSTFHFQLAAKKSHEATTIGCCIAYRNCQIQAINQEINWLAR